MYFYMILRIVGKLTIKHTFYYRIRHVIRDTSRSINQLFMVFCDKQS